MSTLVFPRDSSDAKRLAKAASKGELKRIRRGIYTDADWSEIPQLLTNKWYEVVTYLYPPEPLAESGWKPNSVKYSNGMVRQK